MGSGGNQPWIAHAGPRSTRTLTFAQCRRSRRSERKNHGFRQSQWHDAGKTIKGRKRHILTDTEGNLVDAVVHTADIQDRDGGPLVLAEVINRFPLLQPVVADGGYAGQKLNDALRSLGKWTIEIIKCSDTAKGFEILLRRWVVERTIAWLNRTRHLAKVLEATVASARAWLFAASVQASFDEQNDLPDNGIVLISTLISTLYDQVAKHRA